MRLRCLIAACCVFVLLCVSNGIAAAGSDVADAAMKRNLSGVRSLLQQKADVNAGQADGATALHWAVHFDDLEMAELLIRAGANVKAANRFGVTPLSLACINGNAAMIEKLLKAGADPKAPLSELGETPVMMAARSGNVEAVKVLLDHGVDINVKEKSKGHTALMWAASEGHPAVVKLLLEHGAEVNARSNADAPAGGARRGGGGGGQPAQQNAGQRGAAPHVGGRRDGPVRRRAEAGPHDATAREAGDVTASTLPDRPGAHGDGDRAHREGAGASRRSAEGGA